MFNELFLKLPLDIQFRLKTTFQSPNYHAEGSVYNHLILVSRNLDARDIDLQASVIFHDLGKIDTTTFTVGGSLGISVKSVKHETYCSQYINDLKSNFSS